MLDLAAEKVLEKVMYFQRGEAAMVLPNVDLNGLPAETSRPWQSQSSSGHDGSAKATSATACMR